MKSLKQILDYYADLKNCDADLFGAPDPLQVAKGHRNDVVALICLRERGSNFKIPPLA